MYLGIFYLERCETGDRSSKVMCRRARLSEKNLSRETHLRWETDATAWPSYRTSASRRPGAAEIRAMPLQIEERPYVSTTAKAPRRSRRWIGVAALILLACLVVVVALGIKEWPFTRAAVTQALQQQSGSTVEIGSFQRIYFPHPGCIAQNLVFRRSGNSTPLITIRKLTIMGTYHTLMFHHITMIRAEQTHLRFPPGGQGVGPESTPIELGVVHSGITIGKIFADGAEVEFLSDQPGKPSTVYYISKLALHNLAEGEPLLYHASIQLPLPPADVYVQGKLNPVRHGQVGTTEMSGTFDVENMNLGVFRGIAGTLASKGSFEGVLQHLNVQGATNAPDFEVTESGHKVHLVTRYQALVNGMNGDVALKSVTAQFGHTAINVAGDITGQDEGKGKTASLQLYSDGARIEDLLRLFVKDNTPPMTGAILFRAKATLPPENRSFIDKVQLQGDFGISGAKYPHPETQKDIDVLSARAEGKAGQVQDEDKKRGNDSYDPGRVLSNVKGHVVLRDAVAHLSNVSFDVPGASARIDGTYKLKTDQIDLKGDMHLDTELSKATTGVKSFLLKVIQPLTAQKKHEGSIVTLKIEGTYDDPKYTVLPTTKKQDVTLLQKKAAASSGKATH